MLRQFIKVPVYKFYERRLLAEVRRGPAPKHIGLILDGNRRYAKLRGIKGYFDVYSAGAEKLDDLLEWSIDLGVKAITLWVFSTDNFSRSTEELTGLRAAAEAKLEALAKDPWIHKHRVRVRAVGRLDLLPPSTVAAVRAAEAATNGYEEMQVTLAAAYGGREEITDAVRKLLADEAARNTPLAEVIERVTPEAISRYLYAPDLPDPDLIIRTSGEIRLSGFMLWQSSYSEFYFTDVFWPAMRHIDFLRAVRAFQQRQRRFGK